MTEYEDSYLNKAKRCIFIAGMLMDRADENEMFVSDASFHVQQAAELAMKHVLEGSGIAYPYIYTHDIRQLANLMKGSGIPVPGYIDDNAEMLTSWCEDRERRDFLVPEQEASTALASVRRYAAEIEAAERRRKQSAKED